MSRLSDVASLPCGKRSKWVVVVIWVIVLGVLGGFGSKLTQVEKNDSKAWLPGAAESTKALDRLAAFQPKDVADAQVVYGRDSGITAADKAKIAADSKAFAGVIGVKGAIEPIQVSADGKAAQVIVPVEIPTAGWDQVAKSVKGLRAIATKGSNGAVIHIAGQAGLASDEAGAFAGIDGKLLYATLAVVIIILLGTYRSPVLWLLPIVASGVALTIAEGVIYLLASHAGLTVNGQSGGILVVLVLGAGTDYALLLVARYREELRRHEDRHEAMAVALRRAGPAILASAGTVIAGMLCLLAADSADISGLGPVAAIGIGVGLLAMITLLPALLVIFGRWMFWPRRPSFGSPEPASGGLWGRVGRRIARQPRGVWVVTVLLLGVSVAGLIGFRIGPLSTAQSFRTTPPSVAAQNVLARHFPAGAGQPVAVIGSAQAAPQLTAALRGVPGIAQVSPPQTKDGLVYLQGTLSGDPDSPAAYATVSRVRAAVSAVPGAGAKVGGSTAITMDVENYAHRDRNVIIPLVLVVVLLILGLLLRSVVAPLVLIGTVMLSFGAALGLSSLVFHYGFGFAGADTSTPLFVFVFLVALGIDYNIFLMTRIREESIRSGTRRGALAGLAATGGVITSAGAVLAGTFAALFTLPLVVFAEIGFTVALGVLLDTIIVRSVLVTALTLDIGPKIWWPSALARRRDDPEPPEPAAVRPAAIAR
jgi:putative drug exporter of the RND superfamily